MSLLRRRARSRSCTIHGDNGCEIQGEAGPRERCHDNLWRREVDDELAQEAQARRDAEADAVYERMLRSHWAYSQILGVAEEQPNVLEDN